MVYNVFGGTLNPAQSINQSINLPHPTPKGNNRSQPRLVGPHHVWYGRCSLAPQIDHIALGFPISLRRWNSGAQSVDFGSANWRNFFAPQIFRRQHV